MKKRFMLGAVAASLVWLPPAFGSEDSRIEFQGGIGLTPFAVVGGHAVLRHYGTHLAVCRPGCEWQLHDSRNAGGRPARSVPDADLADP